MTEFTGVRYQMVSSENFGDYMKFLGIGIMGRKAALALNPTVSLLKNEDGTYTLTLESILINSQLTFKCDEEFDETKPDGSKVKSYITIDDNIMVHIQRESNGRTSKHVREFYSDKLIVTTTAEGWDKTATRIYSKVVS